MTTIAVPVMAACLLVTTLERWMTALTHRGNAKSSPCDICNKPDCRNRGWMAGSAELARVLNEEQKKRW